MCAHQIALSHQQPQVGSGSSHLEIVIEDLEAAAHVGERHGHMSVEATRPRQRRIEALLHVCGRHHYDPLVRLKSIHL